MHVLCLFVCTRQVASRNDCDSETRNVGRLAFVSGNQLRTRSVVHRLENKAQTLTAGRVICDKTIDNLSI
jgi:hypothetical protein